MKSSTRTRNEKKNLKPYRLDARAFYLGAHGVNRESALEEIEARLLQDASEEKQERLSAIHALEAKLQQARKEKPEAEALWASIRKKYGDTPPPYFHAIRMIAFALVALVIDALFLAPTMDILSIADPTLQLFAAAALAALCTLYFEWVGLIYREAEDSLQKRYMAITAGAVGIASLIVWGLLRGYELRFAAGLAANPLGQFLADYPVLASVFYIFITLATPIMGAASLHYGWADISRAQTWRRVRKRVEKLRMDEIQFARDLQTEQEHFEEFEKCKRAEFREWRSSFAQFYDRGLLNGARKETLSSVVRKCVIGGVCAIPLALLIPFALVPELIGIPVIVGMACFVYFNHYRHHPSQERYLAHEATRFAVIPDAPKQPAIQVPVQRLLSKGDEQ